MNFYYNGTDIYNDVSVNYCVHEMFAEKQARKKLTLREAINKLKKELEDLQ